MPLIIPKDLPAYEELQQENVFVMHQERAMSQHIRPLRRWPELKPLQQVFSHGAFHGQGRVLGQKIRGIGRRQPPGRHQGRVQSDGSAEKRQTARAFVLFHAQSGGQAARICRVAPGQLIQFGQPFFLQPEPEQGLLGLFTLQTLPAGGFRRLEGRPLRGIRAVRSGKPAQALHHGHFGHPARGAGIVRGSRAQRQAGKGRLVHPAQVRQAGHGLALIERIVPGAIPTRGRETGIVRQARPEAQGPRPERRSGSGNAVRAGSAPVQPTRQRPAQKRQSEAQGHIHTFFLRSLSA